MLIRQDGVLEAPALSANAATESTLATKATESTQLSRLGGGKTAVVATVTASGDTTIHTPASGKAIRLYWISAINDPTALIPPVIKVKIGSTEYYRAYAISHWEPFTGAVNDTLIINLNTAGNVQVTAHIEEITP